MNRASGTPRAVPNSDGSPAPLRLRVAIRGAVQGVGFRPFIYRLAAELGLPGWVNNSPRGVSIEVEGSRDQLETFLLRIQREKPPRSSIQSMEASFLDPLGFSNFEIRPSEEDGAKSALILPDIATCPDCLEEIFDPTNRRYLYPFTNCTNCGPRFTIIQSLPYDRPNTTMSAFTMCEECRAEYENPLDRRFHAQPNACPKCGPHLELWSATGGVLASHHEALLRAVDAIRRGEVVAVKGIGGFQFLADARREEAVARLRARKHREEKPFALMYPNVNAVRRDCEVSPMEERLLASPEAPIVLLQRRGGSWQVAAGVAPGNPQLGIMLPYSPLHHILMSELDFPVVATSGNITDEPICTNEAEALQRLGDIASVFLVHDRPIARHADDSVARVLMGREMVLRRARGYAPLPVHLKEPVPTILAVGAHIKNSIALSTGRDVFLSQHIGDLETEEAYMSFREVIADFQELYDARPEVVAHDMHPEYLSTIYAQESELPTVRVQHHYAHILSCMAENEMDLTQPVLGISWDGTGYGTDGTVWGGEFLRGKGASFKRIAHLATFSLPGGDRAVKEPRRTAMGLLYEVYGDRAFDMPELAPVRNCTPQELEILKAMLHRKINCPVTSSAGRLFDAVAAILNLRQKSGYEGQAAMDLEFAIDGVATEKYYEFEIREPSGQPPRGGLIVDWAQPVREIVSEVNRHISLSCISARFHNTLVEMMVQVAQRAGEERVVLTGGCFQNKYLTERAVHRLREAGFRPYWHQRIPPNDGGIALGQVIAAALGR